MCYNLLNLVVIGMQYFFDVLIILLLFIKIILPKFKSEKRLDTIFSLIFFVYLTIVYSLTLMPFRPLQHILNSTADWKLNFYPFADVIHSYGPAVKEASLNVLMMVPFGLLLPLVKKKQINVFRVGFYTFLLSLFIEVLQMLDPMRASDVTDLITNTIGGIIGYCLFKFFNSIRVSAVERRKI